MTPIAATIASDHRPVPIATAASVRASRCPASSVSMTFMPIDDNCPRINGVARMKVSRSSRRQRTASLRRMNAIAFLYPEWRSVAQCPGPAG